MLYIIATPIGNLEDISLRALRVFKEVDYILAEDTRKTSCLLKYYGVKKPLVSFYEHNEKGRLPRVLEDLKNGKDIGMVSSAGTPTISDPGYKLVRECRREGLPVTAVPGPSSIINALALTSLPHDKFFYLGYLPRKKNERRRLLEEAKKWGRTFVFFESSFRLVKALNDIKEIFGNIEIAVGREMTKKFEEILEGNIEQVLAVGMQRKLKGEFTVVVSN